VAKPLSLDDAGFSDDIRRTVSEIARTLKFDTHEFESEYSSPSN
jgi:hypothetical protein